jgi:hypothetical protein
MLRQQQLTEEAKKTATPFVRAPEETAPTVAETRKTGWRALYETYVTDNPVYWKETNRPDLAALSPRVREKVLSKREKIGARSQTPIRKIGPLLAVYPGVVLFGWIFVKVAFIQFKASAGGFSGIVIMPFILPAIISLALSKNIYSEREKQTWTSLILTKLTPEQIILGKYLPWLRSVLLMNLVYASFSFGLIFEHMISPWILLVIIPMVLTMNLPGGFLALRRGLFAQAAEKTFARSLGEQLGISVPNLIVTMLGIFGVMALGQPWLAGLRWLMLVPWLWSGVNILWARALWRGLLRDFHKAPKDLSD